MELFTPLLFDKEFVDYEFRKYCNTLVLDSSDSPVLRKLAENIFSFRLFDREHCKFLLAEIDRRSNQISHAKLRPNTQNHYGAVLNDLGFAPFFDEFLRIYLNPLVKKLYSQYIKQPLTQYHATMVSYRFDQDTKLHLHSDESEVTLNVCLGNEFEGSEIIFRGLVGSRDEQTEILRVTHEPGVAILHLGDQLHEITPLISGERKNLVLWASGEEFAGGGEEEKNSFYEDYRRKHLQPQ